MLFSNHVMCIHHKLPGHVGPQIFRSGSCRPPSVASSLPPSPPPGIPQQRPHLLAHVLLDLLRPGYGYVPVHEGRPSPVRPRGGRAGGRAGGLRRSRAASQRAFAFPPHPPPPPPPPP